MVTFFLHLIGNLLVNADCELKVTDNHGLEAKQKD